MHITLLLIALLGASGSSVQQSSAGASAKKMHDEGLALLRRRSVGPAREILSRLVDNHPTCGHTHLLAGHCALLLEGDAARAETLYEQASAAFEGESDTERAEALHSFGRLFRQQQRWDEADIRYAAAARLQPSRADVLEEALFVRGKRLAAADDAASAATQFEAGLRTASAQWKPHFAREAGDTRGLCGDETSCARHYEMALELGALPDRAAIGELLSTLAVHHEQKQDLVLASSFLRAARDAFASQRSSAARQSGAAAAAAHLRHAQTLEALYALGERGEGSDAGGGGKRSGGGDGSSSVTQLQDPLPAELDAAAASYEAAIRLNPSLASAYDDLASLLLGTSRLTNFGATYTAALNVPAASQLLMASQRLSEGGGGPKDGSGAKTEDASAASAASERRVQQMSAIETTHTEVEGWAAIVEELQSAARSTGAAQGGGRSSGSSSSGDGSEWHIPRVLKNAASVPRVTAAGSGELMALVEARLPVVLTNLQADAGFAPAASWSASTLRASAGERVVKVSVSQSGRFDGAEDGELWGLSGDEVLVRPPETHMRLSDLLTLLKEHTAESFYLEYNALHQYLGALLREMAPPPPQAAQLRPLLTNLWLGKGSTTSPLHYDEYENLLCQVSGTKELLLFPPDDLPHLEYTARPKGILSYAWPNTFSRAPIDAAARATRVVFAASVNMTHPSERQRDALKRCHPLHCTLRAGETLLLPAYWHHEVYSHAAPSSEEKEQPLNVAINFWFRNETAPPLMFE